MKNLHYPMDLIQYLIFKIIFEYILKKHGEKITNDKGKDKNKPSVKIYINKVKNRITIKIKK